VSVAVDRHGDDLPTQIFTDLAVTTDTSGTLEVRVDGLNCAAGTVLLSSPSPIRMSSAQGASGVGQHQRFTTSASSPSTGLPAQGVSTPSEARWTSQSAKELEKLGSVGPDDADVVVAAPDSIRMCPRGMAAGEPHQRNWASSKARPPLQHRGAIHGPSPSAPTAEPLRSAAGRTSTRTHNARPEPRPHTPTGRATSAQA